MGLALRASCFPCTAGCLWPCGREQGASLAVHSSVLARSWQGVHAPSHLPGPPGAFLHPLTEPGSALKLSGEPPEGLTEGWDPPRPLEAQGRFPLAPCPQPLQAALSPWYCSAPALPSNPGREAAGREVEDAAGK